MREIKQRKINISLPIRVWNLPFFSVSKIHDGDSKLKLGFHLMNLEFNKSKDI